MSKPSDPHSSPNTDLLTTQQTIDLLQITRPTLYAKIRAGLIAPLPRATKGHQLFFRRADVEALRQRLRTEANTS